MAGSHETGPELMELPYEPKNWYDAIECLAYWYSHKARTCEALMYKARHQENRCAGGVSEHIPTYTIYVQLDEANMPIRIFSEEHQ
jgi:hypothetical protein